MFYQFEALLTTSELRFKLVMLQQMTSECNEEFNISKEIKIVISKVDGQTMLLNSKEGEFENMNLCFFHVFETKYIIYN